MQLTVLHYLLLCLTCFRYPCNQEHDVCTDKLPAAVVHKAYVVIIV